MFSQLSVSSQVLTRGESRFFGAVLLARFRLENRLIHNCYAGGNDIPHDPYHPMRRIVILAQLRRFLEKSRNILEDPYMEYLLTEHYSYRDTLVDSMKSALEEMRGYLLRWIKRATEYEAGQAAKKQSGELYEVSPHQVGELLVANVIEELHDDEFEQTLDEQFEVMEKVQFH